MARQKFVKHQTRKQHCKRNDFEIRPVRKEDKWCKHQKRFKRYSPNPVAPFGYVVEIPEYFDGMELDLNGYIVRSKLIKGTLYLQIVGVTLDEYCTRDFPNNSRTKRNKRGKKKKDKYLNIRNLKKINN